MHTAIPCAPPPALDNRPHARHVRFMLTLAPVLAALAYGLIMWRFSVWNTSRMLNSHSSVLQDPALDTLGQCMARALDLPGIRIHIFETEPVNGLAAPDGRIFITRGFFRRYKAGEVSAAELASVIAHELGHVALGHTRRRMIDFSGQNAIRVVLSTVLGRIVPLGGVWIANMLAALLSARLSRQDEFEADAYAAALLTKSGIGTGPQKTLLAKLARLTGDEGTGVPAWLMSHPRTSRRIAAIERLETAWKGA